MKIRFDDKFIAIALSLIFLIFGLATLTHYGINWDTINHLPRGQVYLHYFLTGKKDFNDIPKTFSNDLSSASWYYQNPESLAIDSNVSKKNLTKLSLYERAGVDFQYFMEHDGGGHPPLSDILSSFFNLILFKQLGIVNDIDSYRVYGVLLASITVGLIYWWVSKSYGKITGFIASFSLSIFPLFWSESHFNTEKDIPETAYWSLFIFSTYQAFTKKSIKWIFASGIFFGLALGTKFNILFASVVMGLWALLYVIKNGLPKIKFIVLLILIPVIGFLIFYSSWPYLWADPIKNIGSVLGFYKAIGTNTITAFQGYPTQALFYTTPIVMLVFGFIGLFKLIRSIPKEKDYFSFLVILWFFVPLIRVSLPGANIYGGLRQIMEVIPAIAILVGVGANEIFVIIKSIVKNKYVSIGIIILSFVPLIFKLVEIHPNENVYFNELIGGLSGASRKEFPYWGNSFGAAYRQGMVWINKNAESGANVAYARELIPNIPRIWFRQDLNLFNGNRSGYMAQGEYIIALTYQGTINTSYHDRYLERMLEPVYTVDVDGVSILKVWKNDIDHTKPEYRKDYQITNFKLDKSKPGEFTFDLGSVKKLSRLTSGLYNKNCLNLSFGYVEISRDGSRWQRLPGQMPNEDWSVPKIGVQPDKNGVVVPFAADEGRYVKLVYGPSSSCLSTLNNFQFRAFE